MPSSSWRLIRTTDDGGTQSPEPAPQVAAPPTHRSLVAPTPDSSNEDAPTLAIPTVTESGRDILRGRVRTTSRSSGSGGTPNQTSIGPVAGSPEDAALAEEIRQAEKVAEERGYQAGVARAESELRASVEACGALLDQLNDAAPERTSEVAHAIAELALSVAKRVVQREVRLDPSLLCSALEAAVSTINGSPEAHVLLNPAAVDSVSQAWQALHGRAYLGKKWTFEGDPTLPVGGCTLRYEHGFVEAGLEAQLEEIGIALDRAIPNLARGAAEEEVA